MCYENNEIAQIQQLIVQFETWRLIYILIRYTFETYIALQNRNSCTLQLKFHLAYLELSSSISGSGW